MADYLQPFSAQSMKVDVSLSGSHAVSCPGTFPFFILCHIKTLISSDHPSLITGIKMIKDVDFHLVSFAVAVEGGEREKYSRCFSKSVV